MRIGNLKFGYIFWCFCSLWAVGQRLEKACWLHLVTIGFPEQLPLGVVDNREYDI